jgi:GH15 family glucan-1,4-alpha-glucosidase
MSRSIVLSNGELCVALDAYAAVRDLYYPHVGLEDHARGHYVHRLGIWADGRLSWLSSGEWKIDIGCEPDVLASATVARHAELGVELHITDFVCHERPVFMRRVEVKNTFDRERDIKLYFGHQFEIHKMHGSDTAYFDPRSHTIVHYKGNRVFQISGTLDGEPFQDYVTGRANFQGKEGSHRDADDGQLTKNPIEHGPADSVIGLYALYGPRQSRVCEYWIVAAQSIREAHVLNEYVKKTTPGRLLKTTRAFWQKWVATGEREFHGLTPEQVALYKKSLMYMRAHADHGGGIIASVDSDMFQYGLDTYSYVWTRDSAYIVLALDRAGDMNIARRFFEYCKDVITDEGYFMHKYLPDRSLGSSWHPWYANGREQLPIQEDETAIVVYALNEHVRRSRDLEFLETMYEPLVERAADFMVAYRNKETKLPQPSYDLWERKRGTSTYTCACIVGALDAAAELSGMLGKDKNEARYKKAAQEIRDGIMKYLWRDDVGLFHNTMNTETGVAIYDATIDISSVYGVFLFNVLPQGDPKLQRSFAETVRRLSEGVGIGGIARFENDDYYRIPGPSQGNPWFLTTLWYAEYLIANAKTEKDFDRAREILAWTVRHALPSGVLSEQLNPNTGEQVCAGPLTWAHGVYVNTVLAYLERRADLGIEMPSGLSQ